MASLITKLSKSKKSACLLLMAGSPPVRVSVLKEARRTLRDNKKETDLRRRVLTRVASAYLESKNEMGEPLSAQERDVCEELRIHNWPSANFYRRSPLITNTKTPYSVFLEEAERINQEQIQRELLSPPPLTPSPAPSPAPCSSSSAFAPPSVASSPGSLILLHEQEQEQEQVPESPPSPVPLPNLCFDMLSTHSASHLPCENFESSGSDSSCAGNHDLALSS